MTEAVETSVVAVTLSATCVTLLATAVALSPTEAGETSLAVVVLSATEVVENFIVVVTLSAIDMVETSREVVTFSEVTVTVALSVTEAVETSTEVVTLSEKETVDTLTVVLALSMVAVTLSGTVAVVNSPEDGNAVGDFDSFNFVVETVVVVLSAAVVTVPEAVIFSADGDTVCNCVQLSDTACNGKGLIYKYTISPIDILQIPLFHYIS